MARHDREGADTRVLNIFSVIYRAPYVYRTSKCNTMVEREPSFYPSSILPH